MELLLKASLRFVGAEPPKWHDVGVVLKRESSKFPNWFQEMIDELFKGFEEGERTCNVR